MIFTGRYQDKRLSDAEHLCVRTTLGAPRFRLGYVLDAQLAEMRPPREALGLDERAFRPLYEARLATTGVSQFAELLKGLEDQAAGRAVVLLCFCSLEPRTFCHRRLFAKWLRRRGGPAIHELP